MRAGGSMCFVHFCWHVKAGTRLLTDPDRLDDAKREVAPLVEAK